MTTPDNEFSKTPFDLEAERPAELDELNFEDDEELSFSNISPDDDLVDELSEEDLSPAMPGDSPTQDDLAPETLIVEDGARSPHETGDEIPADINLSVVDEDEIGAGYGLDEAELARAEPLDTVKEK